MGNSISCPSKDVEDAEEVNARIRSLGEDIVHHKKQIIRLDSVMRSLEIQLE